MVPETASALRADHLEDPAILACTVRPRTLFLLLAIVALVVSFVPGGLGTGNASHPAASTSRAITPTPQSFRVHPGPNASSGLQCDGMYWASWVWTNYSPPWCYGHDEPTMSYVSTAAGSGEDANYSLTLPADGHVYTQGDFYATIWIGGVVYDPGSIGNEAYLEFQMYPAPPMYASGASDCLPDGSFFPSYTPQSDTWFACAIVWQVTSSENAAFAGPLDSGATSTILQFHSNDHLFVNLSGVAQSSTQPWQISLTDTTAHTSGTVALKNGSKVLSPYYSTAAAGNYLGWGASHPGAIALAYEIGHSLNPAIPEGGTYGACYPGDGACYSYWPALWGQSGQLQLSLPIMGVAGSRTYPTQIGLSSSVGGESWINNTGAGSACSAPSWSAGTNCIYPWYIYRAQNYSFTFDANNESNDTHDYRNWYQFPASASTHAAFAAPWGTVASTVSPTTAAVEFNRLRSTQLLTVGAGGAFGGQFMEGPYWLNVSHPGCVPLSKFVYLSTGARYTTPVTLSCSGLYNVTFNETGLPVGTNWSVTLNQTTLSGMGSAITFSSPNGSQTYSVLSPLSGGTGIHYVATVGGGTVHVNGAAVLQNVSFALQYEFTAMAVPSSAAAIFPNLAWETPGTTFAVTATVGPSWLFTSWTGTGTGSYSGTANPATVTMNGPVDEAAFFAHLFTVTFTETGLPAPSAGWSVELNGMFNSSIGPTITFEARNGSYSYNITAPHGYTATTTTGSGMINGGDVSVQVQFSPVVAFGLSAFTLELIALVVLAAVVAVVLAVALTRRRRPPPAPPPGPPPQWLGGPPSG